MSKLMKKDFKVVENFKWFAILSLVVFVAGIIMMIVPGMNIGIDYAGGAKVEVELGEFADNDAVKNEFETQITKFVEDKGYSIADKMQVSPNTDGGVTYEFRLEYVMNGKRIDTSDIDAQQEFSDALTGDMDDAEDKGLIGEIEAEIIKMFGENNTFKSAGAYYDADSIRAYTVGATASQTLLTSTIWAILAAIVVILIYIIFRFTLSSGLAAICALAHDIFFMVALTTVFQIPVNSTFIAAAITIIGYSINATIVIFDKVRECKKSTAFAYATDAEIANYAVKHSAVKILLSTLTTLIMVVALVIFSVSTIQEFIWPIIFGLVGGTYSSLFLSPSVWVFFKKIGAKIKAKKA
ncbi:MAG: protein translocase subunit SecF [Clostridia bacterium]|nr:protein translocase subunit SecF [Clostridia bacterium]